MTNCSTNWPVLLVTAPAHHHNILFSGALCTDQADIAAGCQKRTCMLFIGRVLLDMFHTLSMQVQSENAVVLHVKATTDLGGSVKGPLPPKALPVGEARPLGDDLPPAKPNLPPPPPLMGGGP